MEHWVNCPMCGHKLFKYETEQYRQTRIDVNIKCHSCKTIVDVHINGKYIQANGENCEACDV